jgi:hypothetical protein
VCYPAAKDGANCNCPAEDDEFLTDKFPARAATFFDYRDALLSDSVGLPRSSAIRRRGHYDWRLFGSHQTVIVEFAPRFLRWKARTRRHGSDRHRVGMSEHNSQPIQPTAKRRIGNRCYSQSFANTIFGTDRAQVTPYTV